MMRSDIGFIYLRISDGGIQPTGIEMPDRK